MAIFSTFRHGRSHTSQQFTPCWPPPSRCQDRSAKRVKLAVCFSSVENVGVNSDVVFGEDHALDDHVAEMISLMSGGCPVGVHAIRVADEPEDRVAVLVNRRTLEFDGVTFKPLRRLRSDHSP